MTPLAHAPLRVYLTTKMEAGMTDPEYQSEIRPTKRRKLDKSKWKKTLAKSKKYLACDKTPTVQCKHLAKPSKKRRRRSGRAGFCQGSDVSVDDAEGMVYGTCFYYLSFFFTWV